MSYPFKCQYCPNIYSSKDKLNHHTDANHWKKFRPNVHGEPSKKRIEKMKK